MMEEEEAASVDNMSENADNMNENADNMSENADNMNENADNMSENADNMNENADNMSENADYMNENADNMNENADNMSENADNMNENADMSENADNMNENAASENARQFDVTRTSRHEYLGSDMEDVVGRTIYDDGAIIVLPVLPEVDISLMPNQLLPLRILYPLTIKMLKDTLEKDKTFAVVGFNFPSVQYGTTAEICQFHEETAINGLKIIAKGRQRFKILEPVRNLNGTFTVKVQILPELSLPNPLFPARFTCLDSHRKNKSLKSKISRYDASMTVWPEFVYKIYDVELQSAVLISELNNNKAFKPPSDAASLSYWAGQSLPVNVNHALNLIKLNTAIERILYCRKVLSKCQDFFCTYCGNHIATRNDVFSMSTEGPQAAYSNPGGHIHETLTLLHAHGVKLSSETASLEYTWFPGYAWIIATCDNCASHMGWKFIAIEKTLKPPKFWGICRRSISTNIDKTSRFNLLRDDISNPVNFHDFILV